LNNLSRTVPKKTKSSVAVEQIDGMIRTIRGVRVMLDRDLAKIYGVPTFRFNEHVVLTSQIAISKRGRGGRRTLPYAFTEHGALLLASNF
jgi:hypothetical protein